MVTEARTEHPRVVVTRGAGGDQATVKGTRLSIALLAALFNRGESPAGLLSMFPHLTPAALYDAISYYFDHKPEIDEDIYSDSLEHVLAELRGDPRLEKVSPGKFKHKEPFGSRA